MTDNVVDIATRKPIERIEVDENSSIAQYLQFWKTKAKERGIESILIMSVDKDGAVAWDIKGADDVHMLRMQSCLKHLDSFLDSIIWPDPEDDELEIDVELDE